jgi:hypothetical protein
MTTTARLLACALVVFAAVTTSGCTEGGGIGMGVPSSGARWGGGTTNPGVIVGGGPVYR